MSVWIQDYLFYTLSDNLILFYLLNILFQIWPLGALSVLSYVPFTYSHHCFFFFLFAFCLFFCISLNFYTTRCPRNMLYISCSSPRITHFYKEIIIIITNAIRIQIWKLNVFIAAGGWFRISSNSNFVPFLRLPISTSPQPLGITFLLSAFWMF